MSLITILKLNYYSEHNKNLKSYALKMNIVKCQKQTVMKIYSKIKHLKGIQIIIKCVNLHFFLLINTDYQKMLH